MALIEDTDESPVPWLTGEEYAATITGALDGDGEALHRLFFGPSPE